MKKLAYVGVDYHVKTITIAVYLPDEQKFLETTRLNNTEKVLPNTCKNFQKNLI